MIICYRKLHQSVELPLTPRQYHIPISNPYLFVTQCGMSGRLIIIGKSWLRRRYAQDTPGHCRGAQQLLPPIERKLQMKKATLSLLLGLLGLGIFVTSIAMAAPTQPLVATDAADSFPYADPITDTDTISPTTSISHPVASAMAEYFDVNYSDIAELHQEGLGFGAIAHAYFIARTLGVTPTHVISEFESGKGWGVILKEYGLHPGLAGRGGNLGSIMSSRDRMLPPGQLKKLPLEEVDAFVPPGQRKANQSEEGPTFIPPGRLKKSGGDNGSDDHGGPPNVPPGRAKDKGGKGKKK
jgi:hypothetical protein